MVPRILATLVAIGLFIGLMCTDLDSGQRWLVVGINGIDGKPVFYVEGRCSIEPEDRKLVVVCKHAANASSSPTRTNPQAAH